MAQGQHEELHSMLVGNRSVFSHLQFLSPTDAPLKGHPGSLRVSFHYQMVLMSNEVVVELVSLFWIQTWSSQNETESRRWERHVLSGRDKAVAATRCLVRSTHRSMI